ncbi:MAG: hypothetical protein JSS32_10025 [Verrucomicrobia bacterium]|nr:hypothetical protein [Verrucomicrobiota bacterium]
MNGEVSLERNQSSWQLAAVQLSGWTSLPILATSILVLQMNTFWGAVVTILLGNAILWFLRLAIVAMTFDHRQSTLDVAVQYLGQKGKYLVAFLLLLSTFSWFVMQTNTVSNTLTSLWTIRESSEINQYSQISVLIGVLSAVLCMEGMSLLKKISLFIFPILALAFILIVFTLPPLTFNGGSQTISLSGLSLVLATNLGLTADLPTFFRHSRSWPDSVKALILVQMANIGLGLLSLLFSTVLMHDFTVNTGAILNTGSIVLRGSLLIFVFLSGISANVANVYSASVGWEVLAPKVLLGRKEYLILGLGISMIYILISDLFSVEMLLQISESALVNLCMVLILGHLFRKVSVRRGAYSIAWIGATALNLFQIFGLFPADHSTILISAITTLVVIAFSSLRKT